jgi:hypothetical protein
MQWTRESSIIVGARLHVCCNMRILVVPILGHVSSMMINHISKRVKYTGIVVPPPKPLRFRSTPYDSTSTGLVYTCPSTYYQVP